MDLNLKVVAGVRLQVLDDEADDGQVRRLAAVAHLRGQLESGVQLIGSNFMKMSFDT